MGHLTWLLRKKSRLGYLKTFLKSISFGLERELVVYPKKVFMDHPFQQSVSLQVTQKMQTEVSVNLYIINLSIG